KPHRLAACDESDRLIRLELCGRLAFLVVWPDVDEEHVHLALVHRSGHLRFRQLDAFVYLFRPKVDGDDEKHNELEDHVEQRHEGSFMGTFFSAGGTVAHGWNQRSGIGNKESALIPGSRFLIPPIVVSPPWSRWRQTARRRRSA